jgi:hypothetical protein
MYFLVFSRNIHAFVNVLTWLNISSTVVNIITGGITHINMNLAFRKKEAIQNKKRCSCGLKTRRKMVTNRHKQTMKRKKILFHTCVAAKRIYASEPPGAVEFETELLTLVPV